MHLLTEMLHDKNLEAFKIFRAYEKRVLVESGLNDMLPTYFHVICVYV